MFYAEFIAPPKPGIKDKKNTCYGFQWTENSWSKRREPLPSEVYSTTAGEIGHATPSGRSVRHFVFFLTQTRLLFWLGHRRPNNYARSLICDYTKQGLGLWIQAANTILTLTERECSIILILVFLCQQTLRVDMVCVCACLLSKLETGLELTSSSDPSPFVLAVISTGVGRGSTLPIGPVWG